MKRIYLNPVQEAIINSFIREKKKLAIGVCGRGLGKSTIGGEYLDRCATTMPRSRGIIGGPTGDAVKNRILPAIQEHWERIGLIEDQDYIIGKKPPSDWDKPKNSVTKHQNVISFPNGCAISMVSLYSEGGARGGSYQFGFFDEMGWVKRENFAANVLPAMRGLRWDVARLLVEADHVMQQDVPFGHIEDQGLDIEWVIPFQDNPYYLSILMVTSMPWSSRGKWILDYEENPDAFYIEGTAMDNIEVLGPQYLPNLQASMTDLEFQVEVMNARLDERPDAFYHAWDDDKHIADRDPYRPELPLEVSFDFGNFMSCVVSQVYDNTAYTCRALWTKTGSLKDLLELLVDTFPEHKKKEMRIEGDVMGNKARRKDLDQRSLYDEIIDYLRAAGWQTTHIRRRYNPPHAEKHLMLNKALAHKKGAKTPFIRIYRDGAKGLILSMKGAGTRDALQKDKSSEHPKSGVPAEEATHLSDAWDYWYFNRFSYLSGGREGSAVELMIG